MRFEYLENGDLEWPAGYNSSALHVDEAYLNATSTIGDVGAYFLSADCHQVRNFRSPPPLMYHMAITSPEKMQISVSVRIGTSDTRK